MRKGWAADRVSWVCSRGWGWLAWYWHRRHARCCLLGGGGCPRVLGVCGGGMLSGFWGSAPWLPDLSGAPDLLGVFGWVWVGWL